MLHRLGRHGLPSIAALQCLEASERLGSFTKAAQALYLTQGAVSRQVIGLERKMGLLLLERRHTLLVATPAGQVLLEEARELLHRLERVTVDLAVHRGAGRLNLSAPSSFCNYWLAPRLAGFVRRHPNITLNLSTYLGPIDFSATRIDAAIVVAGGPVHGLRSLLVQNLVLRPYACPRLAARWDGVDLLDVLKKAPPDLTLIQNTSLPKAWETWVSDSLPVDLPPSIQVGPRYDLLSMSLHAAIAGIGVALLPDFMVVEALDRGRLVPLSRRERPMERSYHLCYPEHSVNLPALQKFSSWLVEDAGIDG